MGPRTAGLGLETQESGHFEPGKPDSPGFFLTRSVSKGSTEENLSSVVTPSLTYVSGWDVRFPPPFSESFRKA
jgi:hypothetical protein